MCDPISASVMMGASTGLSIFGGLQAALQQRKAAEAQKKYYYFQADQSDKEAQLAIEAGMREADTIRRSAKGVTASQRAAMAASGVGAGSVTAEDVARDTFNRSEMDALVVRYNADLQGWSKRLQARSYRMAGDNALTAGNINADTTLLTTATGVADSWAKFGDSRGWFNGSPGGFRRAASSGPLRFNSPKLNLLY
jgi:hypothetical protein